MLTILSSNVFVDSMQKMLTSPLLIIFVVLFLGYMIGRINIKGVQLGSSGVFIAAIIVGIVIAEFGDKIGINNKFNSWNYLPSAVKAVKDLGLGMFVCGIGFIAGPTFIRNFKSKALSYLGIGVGITAVATLLCILLIAIDKSLEAYQGVGILMGALSTTPGLSAAQDVFGGQKEAISALYGLCYPFGVLGVVLFVQFLPKILRVDMDKEIEKLKALTAKKETATISNATVATDSTAKNGTIGTVNVNSSEGTVAVKKEKKPLSFDPLGICIFSLAVAVGMIVGAITIPLGGSLKFSLGTTGGALLVGLFFAHFGKIGKLSLAVPRPTLQVLRELGLVFFLTCSGLEGGLSFLANFQWHFLLYGAILTLVPMIAGFFIARYAFKLELLNNLGSICGGMTSTPALSALIHVSKTEDVAQSYAATYPISLFFLVFVPQIIYFIFV